MWKARVTKPSERLRGRLLSDKFIAFTRVPTIFSCMYHPLKLFFFLNLATNSVPLTSEVPPSSPKIGNKSEVFLNVTAKDANGEVGFSTAHQMLSAQEPAGSASSFLQLAVKRSGTTNRVVFHWNITSNSNTFFPNDTGPQSGKVSFEEGTT